MEHCHLQNGKCRPCNGGVTRLNLNELKYLLNIVDMDACVISCCWTISSATVVYYVGKEGD